MTRPSFSLLSLLTFLAFALTGCGESGGGGSGGSSGTPGGTTGGTITGSFTPEFSIAPSTIATGHPVQIQGEALIVVPVGTTMPATITIHASATPTGGTEVTDLGNFTEDITLVPGQGASPTNYKVIFGGEANAYREVAAAFSQPVGSYTVTFQIDTESKFNFGPGQTVTKTLTVADSGTITATLAPNLRVAVSPIVSGDPLVIKNGGSFTVTDGTTVEFVPPSITVRIKTQPLAGGVPNGPAVEVATTVIAISSQVLPGGEVSPNTYVFDVGNLESSYRTVLDHLIGSPGEYDVIFEYDTSSTFNFTNGNTNTDSITIVGASG